MKKSLYTPLLSFCLLFLCMGMYSCSKDSAPAVKTKNQLISQKPWHWTISQYKVQDGSLVTQSLDPVQSSATYTFAADGSLTVTGEANGQTTTGTWQLTNNDSQLSISASNSGSTVTQVYQCSVTEDKMLLSIDGQFTSDSNGSTVTYYGKVSTFTH